MLAQGRGLVCSKQCWCAKEQVCSNLHDGGSNSVDACFAFAGCTCRLSIRNASGCSHCRNRFVTRQPCCDCVPTCTCDCTFACNFRRDAPSADHVIRLWWPCPSFMQWRCSTRQEACQAGLTVYPACHLPFYAYAAWCRPIALGPPAGGRIIPLAAARVHWSPVGLAACAHLQPDVRPCEPCICHACLGVRQIKTLQCWLQEL